MKIPIRNIVCVIFAMYFFTFDDLVAISGILSEPMDGSSQLFSLAQKLQYVVFQNKLKYVYSSNLNKNAFYSAESLGSGDFLIAVRK